MQIAISKYIRPLSEIDALRPAHLDFLKELIAQNKILMAGRQNPVTGGVIIANMNSVAELLETLQADPFTKAGVAEYQIIEFTPALLDERLKSFSL